MAQKWYPVIDYMLCEEYGNCIEKCVQDTYDKEKAPMPIVSNPNGCIDHCHGCGDICPTGAITYVGDDTDWTPPKDIKENEVATPCCGVNKQKKNIQVDFLYLDLNSCERCGATSVALDEAATDVAAVLATLGYTLAVNTVEIVSLDIAEQRRFESSPTICVNGKDICTDVRENSCKDCGELCGGDVDCRVFEYEGVEYNAPPKAMIVDAILKAIYQPSVWNREPYTIPENLRTFFSGKPDLCCETGGCCCG